MFHLSDKLRRNVLVACDHGLFLVNRFDYNHNQVGSGKFILDHGNICTVEANYCINAIKHLEEPIIFDIGANIGGFTSWLARYFVQGKIYSFEPQRLVFQILCANLAINNLHNVYAYNMALGNYNSKIKVYEPNYEIPNDFGRFSLVKDTIPHKASEIIIDMITLDDFILINEIPRLDLLKIDTEGMELMILEGSKNIIKRWKPVLLIEYSDEIDCINDQIKSFLDQFGYQYQYTANNIFATCNHG